MSRRPSHLPSSALWARVAEDHAAMLWSAGEVIGRRTAAMAAHGLAPNARERAEMRAMVEEKQAALFEGSLGAWAEVVALQQASWLEAMRLAMTGGLGALPFAPAPASGRRRAAGIAPWMAPFDDHVRTQLRIFDAASKPFREKVAANRKRLRR